MTDVSRLTTAIADRYAIEREVGTGGMATVYLARDLKHDRLVALKVLRPELAAVIGAERFLHEIKVTAKLQHPHILPLHDSGEADSFLFYVMPYVEGETLRERLNREKQLGIEAAVEITRAVAGALDYAHRHGVIHRDIKPENILLHDGQPTIADFGIALAVSHAAGQRLTETGLSLGTPHYMSPEQAMGDRELDARSDIYSLAVVLYEMLTGDPPYTGSTAQAIVAKVITEKAPLVTAARDTVPQHVALAIHKALAKLPADRFPSAAAFSEALARPGHIDTTSFSVQGGGTSGFAPRQRRRVIGGVAAALAAGLIVGWMLHRSPPARVSHLNVLIPGLTPAPVGLSAVLSHDGAAIAYRAIGPKGEPVLFYRRLDQATGTPLPGTEGGYDPTFSPDGQSILFASIGLRKVAINGAPPIVVSDTAGPSHAWGDDGTIYFTGGLGNGLGAIPTSGPAFTVTQPDTAKGEIAHGWPDVLPGGRVLIFTAFRNGLEGAEIVAFDLKTRTQKDLIPGVFARYSASGYLVVCRSNGSLVVVPFNASRLEVTGAPVPWVDGLPVATLGSTELSVANDGTLLYQVGTGARGLALVDRSGTIRILPGGIADPQVPRVSPDGKRVAVMRTSGAGADVWIYDVADSTFTRLTLSGVNGYPAWSSDGRWVLFSFMARGGAPKDLYRKPADGSGPAELLFAREGSQEEVLETPDRRSYVYREGDLSSGNKADIRYRPVGGRDADDRPLLDAAARERAPALSPDGRWLAYVSNESGQDEVFVRPFPGAGGRQQVSHSGGTEPRWNPRGGELFFRSAGRLIAAEVDTRVAFTVRGRRPLFSTAGFLDNPNHAAYDVMPDGQHFMMVSTGAESQSVVLVLNWFEELKTKAAK
jgi:serine/threonine-protein kinase